jgi:hypothetical protein
MIEKFIEGIKITSAKGLEWYCDYPDYKATRKEQHKPFSHSSYIRWCSKYDFMPIG